MFPGKPASLYNQNDPDWAPTQKMGHNKIKMRSATDRSERSQEQAAKNLKFDAAKRVKEIEISLQESPASKLEVTEVKHDTVPRETQREMGCQTDLSFLQIREMEQCIQNMTSEHVELKKKVMEAELTEESFQASEEKTKFTLVFQIS